MAEKSISITLDGYWRDQHKASLPAKSGIYCVYECTHNVQSNTVSLNKLIYIGESDDVNNRVANHEKQQDWLNHVGKGNELCYSFGGVGTTDRERAEAAMIFKHKPPVNDEYKYSFPFDKTTLILSGNTELLTASFTVTQTP